MTDSWRTSSYSGWDGNCVQVRELPAGQVLVRHSRHPRLILAFNPAEWDAFVAGCKDGEFDRGAGRG